MWKRHGNIFTAPFFVRKEGVSLITLVITIIVIIILVAITIYTSLSTVDNANYASFASEYDEVNSATHRTLQNNVLNGDSVEARNQGFTKVRVENPPSNFVSVSDDSISGYLVDLDTINVSGTKTGKGDVINERVTFGKDDVYIYDANKNVYYVKGYYDGEGNLRYKLDEKENEFGKPTIGSLEFTLNEDKSKATVKVVAYPVNGGELAVTGGGTTGTKTADDTYELEITRNGTILITVREEGGSTVRELTISGIVKPKYTISYDANGGTGAPESQVKEQGEKLTLSTVRPTRNSYTFKGWAEDAASTSASYQPGGICTKDSNATLYAVWEGVKYTITFNANGGSGGPTSQIKEHGSNITLSSETPTRSGYTFVGWGTSATSVAASYMPGSSYSSDSNITLFAIWNAVTYTINYNANGGTGAPASQTKEHGKNITLSSTKPTKAGYMFLGWAESSSATSATYQPGASFSKDGNTTLYAAWKIQTYTIKYDANGGTGAPASQTKEHGKEITLSTTVPTKAGYTFLGWAESSTATDATYKAGASITDNKDKTLYAVWSAIKYTITYNANGGTGAPASTEKTHGQTLTLSSTKPTKTGYTFLGWAESSTATSATYQAGGSFSKDANTTLYAVWKVDGYTVKYNANGGTGAPADQTKTHNVALTLSTTKPTRPGYTFKGWSTSSTATTASYQPGGSYTANNNVTLYAVWSEDTYTVTYNENGGISGTAPAKQTKKYGETITLSPSKPSRRRYTFMGWSTASDSKDVMYKLGDNYTENESVTLYAVWESSLIPSVANAPVLGEGMKAVYWDDENASNEFEYDTFMLADGIPNTTIYSYTMGDGITDTKTSKWANAKTTDDGSYWVWIPRYAYKLIYYTNSNRTIESTTKTQYGDIDVLFMYGTSDTQYRDKDGNPKDLPEGYKVHPAFQKMTVEEEAAGNNPLGKWDDELQGIWVMKYEASREDSTDGGTTWLSTTDGFGGGNNLTTNAGNTSTTKFRMVSKPSVTSWRYSNISNMYQNCVSMYPEINTHQMKNSEWGAVAYLTYSPYGRNGEELAVNQCSSCYTGAGKSKGASTVYESSYYAYSETDVTDDSGNITKYAFKDNYAWNTDLGKLASTTGNIYGIYDMSGGAYEYTASYLNNGHTNLTTYGSNLVSALELRNKQIYSSTVSDGSDARVADYELSKYTYGDAIYETSTSYSRGGWCNDSFGYPYGSSPFFCRGGYSYYTDSARYAGAFSFVSDGGNSHGDGRFPRCGECEWRHLNFPRPLFSFFVF